MKLETSPKVTKSKRSLHWCRSISKKYLCKFYYSIIQKVITLSGRRFITVSGVLLHYRAVTTLSGVFYYIIGQLLQYRAFITLSVGTSVLVRKWQQRIPLLHKQYCLQDCLQQQRQHIFIIGGPIYWPWKCWARMMACNQLNGPSKGGGRNLSHS